MHASWDANYLNRGAQLLFNLCHQQLVPLHVQHTHPPDMPGKVSLSDKVG